MTHDQAGVREAAPDRAISPGRDASVLRRELAEALVTSGAVRSPWVREAFTAVPREVFVPRFHQWIGGEQTIVSAAGGTEGWLRGVYHDAVLTVQLTPSGDVVDPDGVPTSSSSMPTVMAGMLEALDLRPGHRVLEIGTGTGYNAALLAHRVGAGNVTTVELDPRLADAACAALHRVGLGPDVRVGDGATGAADRAPFDRIIATAAIDHIPAAWIEQLTPGGIIVADLRGSLTGGIARLNRPDSSVDRSVVRGRFLGLPGAFMPLRSLAGAAHRGGEDWDRVLLDQRNPHLGRTTLDPRTVTTEPTLRFLIGLHLAGRPVRGLAPATDGTTVTGHGIDGSWISAETTPDEDGLFTVRQGGPQRLWDSLESAHAAWARLKRPAIECYTITAEADPALQYVSLADDETVRWPLPL